MINNIIKIRIILWNILALAVFFFVFMAIAPSGHISYVYDFKKDNSFISKLSPSERVEIVKDASQKVIGDPIYFSLETPRSFNEASINIKYKNNNPEINPIMESGILVDKTIWRYKLEPIDNFYLNKLYDEWSFFEDGKTVLFIDKSRASTTINSLADFFDNPPALDEIATYNYDYKTEYLLENYSSSTKSNVLEADLRESYQFYTYIDKEELSFDFLFQDLNRNKDSDEININLYYDNQLIDTRHLADDGNVSDDGVVSEERGLNFSLANMPTGVYKFELRVGNDIVTRQIESKQNKLSFINKLWLFETNIKDLSLYTDSSVFHGQTINPASLQKIKLASSTLDLSETYKQYSIDLKDDKTQIFLEKGDIMLAGNGVFSFESESLLNPNIKKIDSSFDLTGNRIKYILANYQKPVVDGEYFRKEIKFDLNGAYRENSKYSFLISVPGLKADDDIFDSVEIDEIRIDLYGVALMDKIKSLLFNNKTNDL